MLGSTTRTQMMMHNLLRLARSHRRYGKPAAEDPVIRQKLAELLGRVEAMKYHSLRQLTDVIKGRRAGARSHGQQAGRHRAEPRHLRPWRSRS